MKTRVLIRMFLLLAIFFSECTFAGEPAPKPNIILVFIDDMGWADLSCFGNDQAMTPEIDRMTREGIAFDQFYVNSPICSPSRVAISTGQYPQRWKITSYLADHRNNRERGIVNWLNPKAPMLARMLKQNGYATGHFGKWHMGGQRDVTEAPEISKYGFDQSLTNFEGLGPKLLPLTMKPGWKEPRRIWEKAEILGGPVTWMQRSEITSGFVGSALDFIKKAEKDQKPFYVNLWPDDVHGPWFPPLDKWGKNKRELYLGVLEAMDEQLAVLFHYVRDNKNLRDNTLILICSDNGHELGAGSGGILKGCKTNLYEGGIRSPLIVWGPGFIHSNSVGKRNRKSVFAAIDLVPSLLEFSGTKAEPEVTFDGENLLGTMLGESEQSRVAPIFFSRPPEHKNSWGFKNAPDLAIREGDWKFLCDEDGSNPQLYNLIQDVSESKNLASAHPEKVREMTRKVTGWYSSMP